MTSANAVQVLTNAGPQYLIRTSHVKDVRYVRDCKRHEVLDIVLSKKPMPDGDMSLYRSREEPGDEEIGRDRKICEEDPKAEEESGEVRSPQVIVDLACHSRT